MRTTLLTLTSLLLLILATQIVQGDQASPPLANSSPSPALPQSAGTATLAARELSDKKSFRDYLGEIDKTLDASLAATLAGLALAAAAFLLPFEQKIQAELNNSVGVKSALELADLVRSGKKADVISEKLEEVRTAAGSPEVATLADKLPEIDSAAKLLVWSFFFFTGVLVETIVLDPATDLKDVLDKKALADLVLSGGGMAIGIGLMFTSALKIRRVVSAGKLAGE